MGSICRFSFIKEVTGNSSKMTMMMGILLSMSCAEERLTLLGKAIFETDPLVRNMSGKMTRAGDKREKNRRIGFQKV